MTNLKGSKEAVATSIDCILIEASLLKNANYEINSITRNRNVNNLPVGILPKSF